MQRTKAISPEIQGLFDVIKKQAEDYNTAFALIEQELEHVALLRRNLNIERDEYRDKIDKLIIELKEKVDDTLIYLGQQLQRSKELVDDLSGIKELRSVLDNTRIEMQGIRNNISGYEADLEEMKKNYYSLISAFREKSESRLDETLNMLESTINDKIKDEGRRIEASIALRQKVLDGKLQGYEKIAWTINERVNSDLTAMGREIDQLKSIATGINSVADTHNRELLEKIMQINNRLNDKSKLIEDMFEKFEKYEFAGKNMSKSDQSADGQSQMFIDHINKLQGLIDTQKHEIGRLDEKIDSSRSKINVAVAVAAISIIGLIISFIMG
ncbi:MAG: hypothetical protein ACLFR2_04270 [Candidatus Kapaibacterium sp.]